MRTKNTEPLLPNKVYHIFNHAIGDENIFLSRANYFYFLGKYNQYIHPIAKTFAYNLMPNHFHFAIQIRDEVSLMNHYRDMKEITNGEVVTLDYPQFVMQQFSNFFNAYVKAFNKWHNRKGALLIDYLKRKEVADEKHLVNLIIYIHHNARHHGFCSNGADWEFSSLASFLSDGKTKLERERIIELFCGKNLFLNQHQSIKTDFDEEKEFML